MQAAHAAHAAHGEHDGACIDACERSQLSACMLDALRSRIMATGFGGAQPHVDSFNAFIDRLDEITAAIGPYSSVASTDYNTLGVLHRVPRPAVYLLRLELVGVVGVTLEPERLNGVERAAACVRPECAAVTTCPHVPVPIGLAEARVARADYTRTVLVRVVRDTYTLPDAATPAETALHAAELDKALTDAVYMHDEQQKGRYLARLLRARTHPALARLLRSAPVVHAVRGVPLMWLAGARGCALAPEARVRYSAKDWAALRLDPADHGGYFVHGGNNKMPQTFLTQGANLIVTTRVRVGEHDAVRAALWAHDSALDALENRRYAVATRAKSGLRARAGARAIGLDPRGPGDGPELLWFSCSSLRTAVPAALVFYAAGATSDRDVARLLGLCGNTADAGADRYCTVCRMKRCACAGFASARLVEATIEYARGMCEADVQTLSTAMPHDAALHIAARCALVRVAHAVAAEQQEHTTASALAQFENRLARDLFAHASAPLDLPADAGRDDDVALAARVMTLHDMCCRVLAVVGGADADALDHLANMRTTGIGEFTQHAYTIGCRQSVSKMVSVAVKNLERGLDTFNALALRGMYGDMRFALASVRVRNMIKTGRVEMDGRTATSVTEHAKDISQFEKLTALRAVRRVAALGAPSGRTAAASAPPRMRAVHGSSYGFLCPSSTPEGAGVGTSLRLAHTAHTAPPLPHAERASLANALYASGSSDAGARAPDPGAGVMPVALVALAHGHDGMMARAAQHTEALRVAAKGRDANARAGADHWAGVLGALDTTLGQGAQPLVALAHALGDGDLTRVLLDGALVALCTAEHAPVLAEHLRAWRRADIARAGVSIAWRAEMRALEIATDGRRLVRPLLRLERTPGPRERYHVPARATTLERLGDAPSVQRSVSLASLLAAGTVELLDAAECENVYIAQAPFVGALDAHVLDTAPHGAPTHLEVDGAALFAPNTVTMAFPAMNAAPRLTIGGAQKDQCASAPPLDDVLHAARKRYTLWYPQRTLMSTVADDALAVAPYGQVALTAFLSVIWNQEDNVRVSETAGDFGAGRMSVIEPYTHAERLSKFSMQLGGTRAHDLFFTPVRGDPEGRAIREHALYNYNSLDADGIIGQGECVRKNDVLVGAARAELVPGTRDGELAFVCESLVYTGPTAVVMSVEISTGPTGRRATVLLRRMHVQEVGDKQAAVPSQKATIGDLARAVDMPSIASRNGALAGMRLERIMNPHQGPSRMTSGLFFELVAGMLALARAHGFNATAFRDYRCGVAWTPGVASADASADESPYEAMHAAGLHRFGYVRLIDPVTGDFMRTHTGEPLAAAVGFVYTLYLNKLTEEKHQARARGPYNEQTRQPVKGRKLNGGLRMGEMERDCQIAHGAAFFLRDRMFFNSDPYEAHVCKICGLLVDPVYFPRYDAHGRALAIKEITCLLCNDPQAIVRIAMPYAFKLLYQEMRALHIALRFRFAPDGAVYAFGADGNVIAPVLDGKPRYMPGATPDTPDTPAPFGVDAEALAELLEGASTALGIVAGAAGSADDSDEGNGAPAAPARDGSNSSSGDADDLRSDGGASNSSGERDDCASSRSDSSAPDNIANDDDDDADNGRRRAPARTPARAVRLKRKRRT